MSREQYIKDAVKQRGISMKEFSRQINIPYSTLRSILNDSFGGAAIDNIMRICTHLDITVEELEEYKNSNVTPEQRKAMETTKLAQDGTKAFCKLNENFQKCALKQINALLEVQKNL